MIPQNMDNNLAISGGRIQFIDSFQYTPRSSDGLVKAVVDDKFRYLREVSFPAHHFDLMRRKGVYPYTYMEGFSRHAESRLHS